MERPTLGELGEPHSDREAVAMVESIYRNTALRRGPIHALVICGIALLLLIAGGTAAMIYDFRERALRGSERDLAGTALLLSRHFDRALVISLPSWRLSVSRPGDPD